MSTPRTSQAVAFGIEELTGQRRTILLQGRALPYQGVGWNTRLRTKKTTYAGNPVATQQVLGVDYDNTTLEGMFKERFLRDSIFTTSGDDILTPADAVRLFESVASSGNNLAVVWGPITRYGKLVNFDHSWIRPQDLKWTMEFEWSGASNIPARATAAPTDDSTVVETSTNVDDASIEDPRSVSAPYRESVMDQVNGTRVFVGELFTRLQTIRSSPTVPIPAVQGALSAAESVRSATNTTLGLLVDAPYTIAQPTDAVVEVFACEAWRTTLAGTARSLRYACQKRANEVARAAIPEAVAVVVVGGGQTLRDLALVHYGSSDSWQRIADANGLSGVVVAPGAVVVIPAPTRGAA